MNTQLTNAISRNVVLRSRLLTAVSLSVGIAIASTWATSAHAAPINYGDFSGLTVMYQNVRESSITDPLPLYEAPTLVGDSLVFRPTEFGSTSSGGNSDVTDGQLTTTIMALTSDGIQSLYLEESGDFLLIGAPGTFAMAMIYAPVNIRVTHVDGQALQGPMPQAQYAMNIFQGMNPSDGIFSLDDEGIGAGLWSGNLSIDINALLADAGISGVATKIEFSLDNKMATASQQGSTADIHKKDLALLITPNTPPVPEPSTMVLASLGGVFLAGAGWRRRRQGNKALAA